MFRIAFASSLLALASAPSLAQNHAHGTPAGRTALTDDGRAVGRSVSVIAVPTLSVWSNGLTRSLSAAMRYPRQFSNEQVAEGWARVSFKCSDSGAPVGMALLQSSGDLRVDRAALAAVRRIKTLHPLPDGIAPDQRYVAELVFAASPESNGRLIKSLRQQSAARVNRGPGQDIVLMASPNRVAG